MNIGTTVSMTSVSYQVGQLVSSFKLLLQTSERNQERESEPKEQCSSLLSEKNDTGHTIPMNTSNLQVLHATLNTDWSGIAGTSSQYGKAGERDTGVFSHVSSVRKERIVERGLTMQRDLDQSEE